jgi:hypothetical protein
LADVDESTGTGKFGVEPAYIDVSFAIYLRHSENGDDSLQRQNPVPKRGLSLWI